MLVNIAKRGGGGEIPKSLQRSSRDVPNPMFESILNRGECCCVPCAPTAENCVPNVVLRGETRDVIFGQFAKIKKIPEIVLICVRA